jgi:hypothetical protein
VHVAAVRARRPEFLVGGGGGGGGEAGEVGHPARGWGLGGNETRVGTWKGELWWTGC